MKLRMADRTARSLPIYTPPGTLPADLALVVAGRLHKRALGIALGAVLGGSVFLVTAVTLAVPNIPREPLGLLSEFFLGYRVSWSGAFTGLFWGGAVGFVFGWFAAFCRNLVLATWLFFARTRAQIAATRDFLDHI